MSDNGETDTEEPAVPLGEGDPVEGAPMARVAARLHYPIEESEVLRREGDTTIRTPDGPRDLADVLAESDAVYFPDRQSFVDTVRSVVGTGPIPTQGDDGSTGRDTSTSAGETGARADADVETGEPDNAAEAPEGEDEGTPDGENAAEAADDEGEGDETAAEGEPEASAHEEIEDEGEFEFNDPEE